MAKNIDRIVKEITNGMWMANISLDGWESETGKHGTVYVMRFYGGLNGRGDWEDYLSDMKTLVACLKGYFRKVWIGKIDIDSPDDTFEMEIGALE